MKANGKSTKPLVQISTYEERQGEIRKSLGISNNTNNYPISQNGNGLSGRDTPDKAGFVKQMNGNSLQNGTPPPTPVPDYDSTPQNTIVRVNGHHNSANVERPAPKGTMGRIAAATEIARAASADAAELESIESYKMSTPGATAVPPRPPSVYFAPQKSGPPTMKKSTNRSVSVTIGEYGGLQTRKEPTKFDFIGKPPTNGHNDRTDFDVTTQLKHELEKTLSRSNLKKRSDSMDNLLNQTQPPVTNGNGGVVYRNGGANHNSKSILKKTQSANIEALSSMLIKHQMNLNANDSNNNNNNGVNYGNITINGSGGGVNGNKSELRKTESTPINGILRNGSYSTNELQDHQHHATTKTISFKKA